MSPFLALRRAVLVLAGLIALGARAGQAQFKVVTISRGDQAVTVPVTEISWRKAGAGARVPLQAANLVGLDDELSTTSRLVKLHLQCRNLSHRLEGPFRIFVLGAAREKCGIHLIEGTVEVLGNGPSEVRSGEMLAGAPGTMYGVSVRARNGTLAWTPNPVRAVTVYEGTVDVTVGRETTRKIAAGLVAVASAGRLEEVVETTPAMRAESANLYAELDVSAAGLTGQARAAALDALRSSYQRVIISGRFADGGAESQIGLVSAQLRYGAVSLEALYHLRKAAGGDTMAGERAAAVFWLQGAVLQSLGDPASAGIAYKKAEQIDPQVRRRVMERYQVDTARLRAMTTRFKPEP